MAHITTPVEGYTGVVAGVAFADGKGETAEPAALAYFARKGYGITPTDAEVEEARLAAEADEAAAQAAHDAEREAAEAAEREAAEAAAKAAAATAAPKTATRKA